MPQHPNYSGAKGRIDISDVGKLSPDRWAVQPKLDGVFAFIMTDFSGRISMVCSRTGATFGNPAKPFLGIVAGPPNSVFCGELESHTDRSRVLSERRGYPIITLWDAIRIEGRDLTQESYRLRRDALFRAQSLVANPEFLGAQRDKGKLWRSTTNGRYQKAPRDWRQLPIVEQFKPSEAADTLWSMAKDQQIEGLVAVNLDAPIGRRRAKLKCKPISTMDCMVKAEHAKTLELQSFRGGLIVSKRVGISAPVGSVVEIAYEGSYSSSGTPRFARLVRRRFDLERGAA